MLRPTHRTPRPRTSPSRKFKPRPFAQLELIELEDRSLMAVTSSLTGGVLSVGLSADGDQAKLSLSGANLHVFDGLITKSFPVASITSVSLIGGAPDNQSVTVGANLNLPGTFTSIGVESITFSSNLTLGARSTTVSNALAIAGATTVTVGAGATLFTRSIAGSDPLNDPSTANSGGLSFTAKSISIGQGARLLTHASDGFQAGDLTLTAKDSRTDTYMIPLFNEKQAIVSIDVADDAILQGRNISLIADAASKRITLYELGSLVAGPATLPSTSVTTGLTFTPGLDDGSEGPSISRSTGSWVADNFAKDTTIAVSGTPNGTNDGTYDIESISTDGKSLLLVPSNALRAQTVGSGTSVKIGQVKTDLAAEDVPFVAVDENGQAVATPQKQSDITANAQPPVGWNPVLNVIEGLPTPVQVSLTQVYAKTTVGNNVQITGSGNVTISSSAVGNSQMSVPSLVLGVTWTESDVQAITKIGNATITAAGSFSATAELENHFSSASQTLGGSVQNPLGGDPVQIPGPSISITVARGNSIAIAETSDGTTITAGGVTVEAVLENEFSAESSATTSNAKSFAGSIGVTVAKHNAEAVATLRGTVISDDDVTVNAEGENSAVETRTEASVNTEEPEPASPLFDTFGSIVSFLKSSKDKQDDKSKNEQSQEGESGTTLQIAGAVAIAFSSLSARASIANNATVTVNGGELMVTASSSNAPQSSAVGSAEANSKIAVGGAFVYADYSEEAKAWIGDNAVVNADQSITVSAASSEVGGFPTSWGDFVGGIFGLRDTGLPWVGDGSTKTFSDAVANSGSFADAAKDLVERGEAIAEGDWSFLLQEFSTSFVSASSQPGEVRDKDGNVGGKSNAASGNFDMIFAKSHATAWIGEGAQINQNTPNADADQSVTVEATTEAKALYFGGLTGQGNPFGFTTVGGNGAIGGVYAHHDYDMLATAYIADGVQVKALGDVEVNAENNLIVGVWDFAGSSGKNFGVQGTFTVTPVDSVTLAYIENSAVVDAGGDLTVSATTDNLFIGFTGAIAKSDKVGVGAGLGYFDVDTTTKAFVGNVATSKAFPANGTLTVGGDTEFAAETSSIGIVIAISAALSTTPSPTPPPPPPPPPTVDEILDGGTLANLFGEVDTSQPTNTKAQSESNQESGAKSSSGFGLSASLGLNLFDSVTFAGIDSTTLDAGGNVSVTASSDELFLVATGAASLNLNTKASSSTSLAGAMSWNDLDRNVSATINNAAVSAKDVTVAADSSSLLVSLTAGAAVTSPTQKSKSSIGFAGSANVNDLDTIVSATITGTTTVAASGAVRVTADHDLTVVSISGAVGVSQRAGIGAAFDLGFFATTVEARIGDGVQVTADGDVTVSAIEDSAFVSIGASIGIGTEKFGLAGSASWTNNTVNVTAAIGNNVKLTSGGDLKVVADEDLSIFALGGAAGLGKGGGFGAGIAGINLKRNVNATIGTGGTIIVAGSTASGDHGVFVRATTDDDLYIFGAGGAVALNQAAIAGSLALLIDTTTTNASIGGSTTVTQMAGQSDHTMSVMVSADHDSNVLAVGGALGIGSSVGLGFGVIVMPITHNVTASIASSAKVTANDDIRITADHRFDADTIAAALGVATKGTGVAGSGVILPLNFTTTASVGSSTVLRANGNIAVTAASEFDLLGIAGQGALGVGGSGVGVANVTTIRNETVRADIGKFASITALGNKNTFAAADDASTPKAVRGLIVTSTLDDDVIVVAAGAAGGTSGVGIAGSAGVTVQTTNVIASLGDGATVTPGIADRATANAVQSTYLYAEHLADLTGAGGAGGFGSNSGIGAGVDVGTITRTTRAIIGNGANVYNRGDTMVRAVSGGDWISIAASLGGGGTAGIAGSASVQVHNITTQGRIDDNATVFSGGNVVVTAKDDLQIDSIAGQISIGGTAGVGGSVPVVIVTKTTDASIGNTATVDALANTSAFQANITPPSVAFTDPLFFSKTAVNVAADSVFLGYVHGFQTGDRVTYWANGTAIGGLSNNTNYYAIVVDTKTIKLADTLDDAKSGKAIDLTGQGTGTQQSIVAFGEVAAPPVNNANATGDTLSKKRTLSFGSTGIRGVVVSAISIDDTATYGISGGGGGTVGVQIVASVSIPKITTTASIGTGAAINMNDTGANAGQSVVVSAIADFDRLGIGGSLAIGGTAGIAPLADVLVSKHVTKASIGSNAQVGAERDVIVSADASEEVRAYVVGVAGGGTAAVAGSVGVVILKTQTQALVGTGADVFAKGNVIVSANDQTDSTVVIGSAALGLGAAGVGASVDVSVVEKDTLAQIGTGAKVTALASGGSVNAYTGDGTTKSASAGVIVQAVSDEDIFNVIVAGGAGFYAGVAGAVNVNLITANTKAELGSGVSINGSGTADADQSVIVAAIDQLEMDVIGGAAGLGAAGVAGSVDVGIIRSNTTAVLGANVAVNAKQDIAIGSAAVRDIGSTIIGASAGVGALAASVGVYSLYATVDAASKNSLNGKSGSNGASYADSATNTTVISNGLGSYDSGSTFEGGRQLSTIGNSAKTSVVGNSPSGVAAGAVNATPTASGTSATVGSGAKLIAGGNLSVLTSDSVTIDVTTGSGAAGAAGIGASVSYVSVGGQSLSSIGDTAILTGSKIRVAAAYTGDGDASAYGGAAGGFVGIGAQVAVLNDAHLETASVGNAATVTASNSFAITTTGNRTLETSNAGGGVSLGFAAGASYATINSTGSASATLGSNGNVSAGTGGVLVASTASTSTDASAVGVAAGAIAINLTLADVTVSGGAISAIGSNTNVTSLGDVTVKSVYATTTDLDAVGVSAGLGSVGAMDVKYTDTSSVAANLIGVGKFDIAGSLNVLASSDLTVDLNVTGTSVGGVTGNGAGVTVNATPTVSATAAAAGTITASKSIAVVGRAGGEFDAATTGVSVGGVSVGVSIVTVNWSPSASATVGVGTVLAAAEDLTVRSLINYDAAGASQNANTLEVRVTAVSGGLAAGSAAVVSTTLKPTSATTIGAGASLTATNQLRIGSDQRSRTNVNLTGVNAGFVAGGAVVGDSRVHASSTVSMPDSTFTTPTRISGSRGITVKSGIDHGGRSNVVGGAGGLFGAAAGARFNYYLSGPDGNSNSDYIPVTVAIGRNTVVSSTGLTDLGTFVRIDFESDSFLAGIGGLGSAVDSDLTTESYVASAVTIGEDAKIGTRNLRVSTDQNVRSDTDTDAQAYGVFGSSTTTDSTSRYYATNAVSVGKGAVIVATGAATLENANGNVYVRADSYARGVSFFASVFADSYGTRRMTNSVSIANGSEIITPRLAVQSLRPTGSLSVTADSTNASAAGFFISIWNAITGGDVGRTPHPDGNVGSDTVDLNAAITLGSPRNVQLTIDANGGITRQNWPTAVIEPTRIVVDDIFSAQPERLDVRAPNGTTKGSSTVTYGVMETVTVENASKRTLQLRNIDTYSAGLNTPVYNHEGSSRGWTYTESKSPATNGESTQIIIRNTAVGTGYDVQLAGRIDAVAGSVNITANGGDVYSLSPNGFINSRIVTLNATAGALGRTANPLFIRTPEQTNKTLPVGIQSAHGETGGNLNVSATSPTATDFTYRLGAITSNTGLMKIVANEGSRTTRGVTTEVQLDDGSAYQGTVLGLLTFDPANASQFNAANDTITLPYDHGLKTGDRVAYQPVGATPIGGIVPWIEREVSVVDSRTIRFTTGFSTGNVSTAKDTITFGSPHGIQIGEAVVYDTNGGTAIGGLTNGSTSYAWSYDANTIQLYNSQANATAKSLGFQPNTVQHIPNPGYDKDATSGIATLKYLDVIAMSDAHSFTTGTKLLYWTADTNLIREWTDTSNTYKYWTNTLTFDSKDPDPNDSDYTQVASSSSSSYVQLPSLSYFYAVAVPNPGNKEEYRSLIAIAASATDATDGKPMKIAPPASLSQETHYFRTTTGLINITSAPANQSQSFRADLTAPALAGGLHIIDTNSVYIRDAKGAITRVDRDAVRSIRDVIAETLTTPTGTKTTVELGAITSKAGSIRLEVGTDSQFLTDAKIVDTLSAAAGTITIEVDGGSLLNAGTNTNLIATTADLTTWNNIGSASAPITGKVQFLTATAGRSGSGGIWFENTGALTLHDMTAVNDIVVQVVDQTGTGDDLTVDPNFTIQSSQGEIALKAGDKLYVPTNAKISAANGVNLYFNYGNVDGTGGTLDLRGQFFSNVVNIYGDPNTIDTVLDDNDMNFEIGDSYLRRYVNKTLDTTFNLFNVTGDHFDITAGGLDNSITVTDWTGTGVFDGGAGINKVVAINDVDFTLADSTLLRTNHGAITFVGDTVRRARLAGGTSDNRFTVTNWTGQASLDGAGGLDTVADVNDVHYTLDDTFLTRSTAGTFNLRNIERAELTAGAIDNRFEISDWTGIAVIDGGAGINTVASVRDGDYKLADTSLDRTESGAAAGHFDLTNITKSMLIGGVSDNTFEVGGWTGQASIDGSTGSDRVTSTNDSDAYLTDDFLSRSNGGQFAMQSVELAVLRGGAGSNAFLIEGWSGSASVNGMGGGDTLTVNATTDYTLNASSVLLGNGSNINIANVTKVALTGGDEDNTIRIDELPEFFTVIRGGGGDNAVFVGAGRDFALSDTNLALDGRDRFSFEDIRRLSLVGDGGDNSFQIEGWSGDLAIHAGGGQDTVLVNDDTNYSLTAGAILVGPDRTINLTGVENVELHGGASDNRFELIDWVGQATIYGGGGQDVVSALVPGNVVLSDGWLAVQGGADVALVSIERAVLIGQPGQDHAFVVQEYSGEASIHGSAGGFNRLVVASSGTFDLTTGHLVLGTGATIDFQAIDATVLRGGVLTQNHYMIGAGTGAVSVIGGNTGLDEVTVIADADFVLDDSAIELSDGTVIDLSRVTKATLVGGPGDNTFNLSGWTGFAHIDGGAGDDTIVSTNNTDFVLVPGTLQRGDGAVFSLTGIENAILTGGVGNNQFFVEEWRGRVELDGGEGGDEYTVGFAGSGRVSVNIADSGSTGTDSLTVLIPQGNTPEITMHGVWLGDEEALHFGIEDFVLI